MNSINNNYSINFGTKKTKNQDNSNSQNTEKETKKFSSKFFIEATAAAAIMAGIILLAKKNGKLNFKNGCSGGKDIEEIQNIWENYSNITKKEIYGKTFDVEKTQQYIEKIIGLAKKGKEADLKFVKEALSDRRGLLSKIEYQSNSLSELPEEIQAAIRERDYIKTYELYSKYADGLFTRSKTAGKTKAQSVLKTFGEKTPVKSHNYDLSKESDKIVTMQYNAEDGYVSVNVNSENMIPDKYINLKHSSSHEPFVQNRTTQKVAIHQGTHDGKKFVTIEYPSNETNKEGQTIANAITIISPDGNLTPVQNDLLNMKNLSKEELDILKSLTNKEERTNFDAILSVISTFAKR